MRKISLGILFSIMGGISFSQNIADGKANDWQLPLRYYDSEAHLQYNVTNNDSMLFICVRIPDKQFQMKVAQAGMTLYIDTTGKKKQNIGIDFPIKPSNPALMKLDHPDGFAGAGINKIIYMVEPALKQFNSKGFITGNGTFQLKNNEGMIVTGAFDSSYILTIEYQIPIRTFYHTLKQIDADRKITCSLVVNGLSMPPMNRMQGEESPMERGDGMPGGEPPMDGGNRPDFQEMEALSLTTTSILKYNFQITK